jgi:hypothetical protein
MSSSIYDGVEFRARCSSLLLAKKFGYPEKRNLPPQLDPDCPESFFNAPHTLVYMHKILQRLGLALTDFAMMYRAANIPPLLHFPVEIDPPLAVSEVNNIPWRMCLEYSSTAYDPMFCLIQDYAPSLEERTVRKMTSDVWNKHGLSEWSLDDLRALLEKAQERDGCPKYTIGSVGQLPWWERRIILLQASYLGLIPNDDYLMKLISRQHIQTEYARFWRAHYSRRRVQIPALEDILAEEAKLRNFGDWEPKSERLAAFKNRLADELASDIKQSRLRQALSYRVALQEQQQRQLQEEEQTRQSSEKRRIELQTIISNTDSVPPPKHENKPLPPLPPPPPVAPKLECPVCMEPTQLGAFIPCGHMCCTDCYKALPVKNCPTCRKAIANHFVVYLP